MIRRYALESSPFFLNSFSGARGWRCCWSCVRFVQCCQLSYVLADSTQPFRGLVIPRRQLAAKHARCKCSPLPGHLPSLSRAGAHCLSVCTATAAGLRSSETSAQFFCLFITRHPRSGAAVPACNGRTDGHDPTPPTSTVTIQCSAVLCSTATATKDSRGVFFSEFLSGI